MTTHHNPHHHLPALRTTAATLLTRAITTALATNDRLTDAHRAIHHTTPTNTIPHGHLDLARREATYRLADAAHLQPRGLLTPNLAQTLANRDTTWPRPTRRTALLTALAHLPTTPNPTTSTQTTQPNTPTTPTTLQLTHHLHTAAHHAATHLRTTPPHTLHRTLADACHHTTTTLPTGYAHLLERELTLRLARTLALPVTGALAPGLDTTLAHAIRHLTPTDLADLLLTAVRPTTRPPTTHPTTRLPAQRTGTCPCPCTTGGFCGGCGHADCGGRP